MIALAGLLLQIVVTGGLLLLGTMTRSSALIELAWFVLGGVPIWFVALLVFRQSELAELERMDLAELRRQKAASGGGEAIFDQEGAGGLGYLVAETRLDWMRKWLVPIFGLVVGAYLAGMGVYRWTVLQSYGEAGPQVSAKEPLPLALIGVAVAMLLMFLVSRFASGLGRVPRWQMLRACGSYTLGNVFGALALIVCQAARLYADVTQWERVLAWAIPVVMVLVGAEILINFVLDIYRPRAPGTEPRASFDSRLLGLFSEPGGLAASIAEAMNYQFGFQVSQTWFYQLLQRALLPLLWCGAVALWLLTCIVIVEPHQRAIIVSWGRQVNPDQPLGPGIYLKAPAPFATAQIVNTQQLEQMTLGRKSDTDDVDHDRDDFSKGIPIVQWTDQQHGGYDEFNFLVAPPEASGPAEQPGGRAAPVHVLRMTVAIQWRVEPDKLDQFTRIVEDPPKLLRRAAWQELLRFSASHDTAGLLGELRKTAGETLRQRIESRLTALLGGQDLGLKVEYVGLQDVHPERSVATTFREVVSAEQEKITAIRRALTDENTALSRVAGDKDQALALTAALREEARANRLYDEALRAAERAGPAADRLRSSLEGLRELMQAEFAAGWERRRLEMALERARENVALGVGFNTQNVAALEQDLAAARQREAAAVDAVQQAVAPLRSTADLEPAVADAIVESARGAIATDFWRKRTTELLLNLQGEVAVVLADAQARRWSSELKAVAELVAQQKQTAAFRAAPEIFKARAYWQAVSDGLRKSRKYLLAFDAAERDLRVRLDAEEQPRPDSLLTPSGPK